MSREDSDLIRHNETNAASGRSGPNVALIAFGIVMVLAVVFFLQNGDETTIDFWFFESTTTIRWSILMSILLGVVLDRVFSIWWRRRRTRKEQ
jgi:uncharacterized integral membrane protein